MAQYPEALEFLLANEDSQHEYAIVPDSVGFAISGINSHSWPSQYETIAALPQNQRAQAVSDFYLIHYWNPMKLGGINSQDLANRVMDQAVNGGFVGAVKMLQEAANSLGATLTVDGFVGPATLEAVNALDPERMIAAYRLKRQQYYADVIAKHPSDLQFLKVWDKRALA
jgi:lysozyme family protein